MINLLPPEVVKDLRASRTNTILRRYLITSLIALVVLVLIFGAALYLNQQNYQFHKQQQQESQQELTQLKDVKQKIAAYNEKIATAEEVYETEIEMTTLIANLSSVLPAGTVLSGISFNVESLSDPVLISAQVNSFEKAGVLKSNFAQSKFFSEVVLQQVSESSEEEEEPSAYPFTAQLEVTLTPEASQRPEKGEAL